MAHGREVVTDTGIWTLQQPLCKGRGKKKLFHVNRPFGSSFSERCGAAAAPAKVPLSNAGPGLKNAFIRPCKLFDIYCIYCEQTDGHQEF